MPLSRRTFLQLSGAAALSPSWPYRATSAVDTATAAFGRRLASDPLRPQYHLLPARNWMNDPNGPIFFRGRYHMFHQYNPQGAIWGNMNWAHATSLDMIHWQHEPIALSPTPDGPDSAGVFSGSAVLDNGIPTVIYTAVAPPTSDGAATLRDGAHIWRETQCLAVAQDDDLRTWKKLPQPVIATPPAGLAVTGFRDPCLWREGNEWMLILGSGVLHQGGTILLYTSTDLRRWTYLHPLLEGAPTDLKSTNPVDTGEMWECPDFFPLGNKHVLLISTMGKVRWKVGTYSKQRFTAEKEGVLDWGSYYAAKTMRDADGNLILWGWIPETRPDADLIAAGWAGVMSLPRTLSLSSDGELQTDVSSAVHQLRAAHTGITSETDLPSRYKLLHSLQITDLAAELKLELVPKADEISIHLQTEGGENFASIHCANKSGGRELRLNRITAPLAGAPGTPIFLRAYLDGSVLELFANQTTSLTARIYQTPPGPLRLKIESSAELRRLDAWQLTPISKDRLTGSVCA
jgi:beta-fructofuranosidase